MGKETKLLYVDDEEINLLILAKRLGKKFKVLTADSGQKGLEILHNNSDIEFVISDLKMPGMSGLEFINEAKKHFNNKKYFILTGYNSNEDVQKALDSGLIQQCWVKPADFNDVEKSLQ